MKDIIKSTIELLDLAEKIKTEERHCWYTNGRRESVAEHTWRMALMAMLIVPYLSKEVDMEKVLKMIIVHDLVEADAGDVPFFLAETPDAKRLKMEKEQKAISRIKSMLNSPVGDEIYDIWQEYEERNTYEALVSNAIDKLEANIQHNQAPIETWTPKDQQRAFQIDKHCQFDPFIKELNEKIKELSALKLDKAGIDSKKVIQDSLGH